MGDLFAGAFIPGIGLALLYGLYIAFRAFTDPKACPALPMTAEERRGLGRRAVVALVPPLTLIGAVLGSIIAGVATPTESASVGSLGAIFLMLVKLLADHHLDDGSGNVEMLERRLMRFWLGFLVLLVVVAWGAGAFGLLTLLIVAVALGTVAVLLTGALRAGSCRSSPTPTARP